MERDEERRYGVVEAGDISAVRKRVRDRQASSRHPWERLVAGSSILAVGLIVWLDHLHRLNAYDYLRWWPIAFIALGIAHLTERRWGGAGFLMLIGLLFMPRIPFFPHLHVSQVLGLWPLLISVGGLTLVMQALRPAPKHATSLGTFRAIAVMGGSGRTISAERFLGGDVVAVMGGCDIDLRSAEITGEAVIDVLAFWGGMEIKVPRGWQIETHVTVLLGALNNKTSSPPSPNAPRLVIRGSVIMGGIEIRNPREES